MVACQSGEEKELTKVEKIQKKGKLVIGTSAAYPPYEFHKEIDGKDTIVGFDIDIAKEIANDLGVELEIKDMQFAGLLAALNAKKIDIVIAGMTPTEDRKKSVDFSKVYYTAKQGVVVSKEKADEIKTKKDLEDKKIGVQKGTTQEKIAKENFKEAKIVGLGKISDIMLQVMQKKIDAVIAEKPVAESYAKKNDSIVLSNIALNTGDSGSAVAIKKGNESLVKAVNETLDKLKENGKIAEFVTKATEMNN
ncbi:MAG: transporter substrate-binding domain-containing protein [Firmicutes bacterium]|nr:transporter substrate-binding domain-containing protein [Bacillota bacterium]